MWRIAIEVIFVAALIFAGGSFWSCLKTPKHLRKLLREPAELDRLVDHWGHEKLLADSEEIRPVFGSFAQNIAFWDGAHYQSLSRTRNGLALGCVIILCASWWLGAWEFVVSLAVFALLGIGEIPASAKNLNANHLASVSLNLLRWNKEDELACSRFCELQRPEFSNLYRALTGTMASQTQSPAQ